MCDWVGCDAEAAISFSYLRSGGNLCEVHSEKFQNIDNGMQHPKTEEDKKLYIRRLKSFLRNLKGYHRFSDVSKFVDPNNLHKNCGVIDPIGEDDEHAN